MQSAVEEAVRAGEEGEVPIGAVVVLGDEIIGRGHNQKEHLADPTAHAEILALREAARRIRHWRLIDSEIYVTLEPCAMCAGAMVQARVARCVYGVDDPKAGAAGSLRNILEDPRLNHRVEIVKGILAEECASLLKEFFRSRREE
jgi:tRNA(adenine34) deaminase